MPTKIRSPWIRSARHIAWITFWRIRHVFGAQDGIEGADVVARWITPIFFAGVAFWVKDHIPGVRNLYDWAPSTIAVIAGFGVAFFLEAVRQHRSVSDLVALHEFKVKPESIGGDACLSITNKAAPCLLSLRVRPATSQGWGLESYGCWRGLQAKTAPMKKDETKTFIIASIAATNRIDKFACWLRTYQNGACDNDQILFIIDATPSNRVQVELWIEESAICQARKEFTISYQEPRQLLITQ